MEKREGVKLFDLEGREEKKMKATIVTTVLNEEKTIDMFLDSVANQSLKPDEVIVVDGGSVDWTVDKMQRRGVRDINLKIFIEKGANRSQGRNAGIKEAKNEIIAITDAGCILDKDWFLEIIKPFSDPKVEVVAGYYQGMAKTVFEKCVVPYVLVMPDEINPYNFYPASRSMAIRKGTFWQVGGFQEEFSDNEDYVFANKLAKNGIKSYFCTKAIVNWLPRPDLKSFWTMIFRFARGDARAGLRELRVATIFGRYLIFILISLIVVFNYSPQLLSCLPSEAASDAAKLGYIAILLSYFIWSVEKNYRYVNHWQAFIILPLLQIASDLAVMVGTIAGLYRRKKKD